MARHLLLVMSDPVPGREAEYHRWYDETHLDDVLKVDGFVSAERFAIAARVTDIRIPGRFAAIYEMDSDDPEATFAQLATAAEQGNLPLSDALDVATISVTILTPIAAKAK